MGSLIAGAKYREFEDRLRAVLREVMDSNGQIVLFIDELHTLLAQVARHRRWMLGIAQTNAGTRNCAALGQP